MPPVLGFAQTIQNLKHAVLLFSEADRDRSRNDRQASLGFEEWRMLMRRPPSTADVGGSRTLDDLRKWFNMADLSGEGRVTLYDFVMLVLRAESARADGLNHLFMRWDRSKSKGSTLTMNAMEWGKAADDLGCARFAPDMWERLDPNESGGVSVTTLSAAAHAHSKGTASDWKGLLRAMDALLPDADAPRLRESDKRLQAALNAEGTDKPAGLRYRLRQYLSSEAASVAHLAKLLEPLSLLQMSMREWKVRMSNLGYRGPGRCLEAIFQEATRRTAEDEASSIAPFQLLKAIHKRRLALLRGGAAIKAAHGSAAGSSSSSSAEDARAKAHVGRVLGYDELFEWLEGERHSLDPRSAMRVKDVSKVKLLRESAVDGTPRDLMALEWGDPRVMREELQAVCRANGLTPSDLLWSWNKDGDGEVSKRELLIHMKKLVDGDVELWDGRVREATVELYLAIAGEDQPALFESTHGTAPATLAAASA